MNTKIIDCIELENNLSHRVNLYLKSVKEQYNVVPSLVTVLVGNNASSEVYVTAKVKKASELGIDNRVQKLPETISEEDLINEINILNNDNNVNGILLQLPLPSHINPNKITSHISPKKDVDGLHASSLGSLLLNNKKGSDISISNEFEGFIPCTPYAVIYILSTVLESFSGKHAVVVGRSNLVGKPVAQLLLNNNCTVTTVHSKSTNIKDICKQADILIAAVGKPNYIDSSFIKEGAIVIDVGISKVIKDSGAFIKGDVNYTDVIDKVGKITKVPKGVGRLTVMFLMINTIKSFVAHHKHLQLDKIPL